jgi:nitroreductase
LNRHEQTSLETTGVETNTPILEIIRTRRSCRSYNNSPIDSHAKERLDLFLSENRAGPFGSKVRFSLIAATEEDNSALKGLGTYGFIRGATGFIVGAAETSEKDLEDFGYLMEQNVLCATGLNLGTCWLGGTFNKSMFSESVSTIGNETVPAVAAVGHPASRRRILDSAMRRVVGSNKRKPWADLFFDENFDTPLNDEKAGAYATPLETIRMAPSASNNQPWRIVRDSETDRFHFYLQRTEKYRERNKKWFGMADLQRVDMGIAMCHLALVCKELGLKGSWKIDEPRNIVLPERTTYSVTWMGL